jgi:uncharacterized protein YbjT (DUF2867 family)
VTPAAALRAEAVAAGVLLRLTSDGRLKITGGGSLELLGRLRQHHAELLALLQAETGAANAATPEALADEAEVGIRDGVLP